jgi:hypothetical protein
VPSHSSEHRFVVRACGDPDVLALAACIPDAGPLSANAKANADPVVIRSLDGRCRLTSAHLIAIEAVRVRIDGLCCFWRVTAAFLRNRHLSPQVKAVLKYFQACKSFVTKNPKLDDWIAVLKEGRVPDLSQRGTFGINGLVISEGKFPARS